jgi:hypothetical protein
MPSSSPRLAKEHSSHFHPGAAYTDMTGMRKADQTGLHRGTGVAVVASLVRGGWTLSMVPLGLLGMLVSPVDVPVWREAVVDLGAVLVGSAMLAMARSVRVRRPWARPVAIVILGDMDARDRRCQLLRPSLGRTWGRLRDSRRNRVRRAGSGCPWSCHAGSSRRFSRAEGRRGASRASSTRRSASDER